MNREQFLERLKQIDDTKALVSDGSIARETLDALYMGLLLHYCKTNDNSIPRDLFTEIQNRLSKDTKSKLSAVYSTTPLMAKVTQYQNLLSELYEKYGVIRNRYSSSTAPISLDVCRLSINVFEFWAGHALSEPQPDSPDNRYKRFKELYHALFSKCSYETLYGGKVTLYTGTNAWLNETLKKIHNNPANAEHLKRLYEESKKYLTDTKGEEVRFKYKDYIDTLFTDEEVSTDRNFFEWYRFLTDRLSDVQDAIKNTNEEKIICVNISWAPFGTRTVRVVSKTINIV